MQYLQIALAITLTMLIFSTLASMLVEVGFRAFRVRKGGLRQMIQNFVLGHPVFGIQFSGATAPESSPVSADEVGPVGADHNSQRAARLDEITGKFVDLAIGNNSLAFVDVVRGLAGTDFGKRLGQLADEKIDAVFTDLAARYEHSERKATNAFRSKSYLWNCVASVIIALALNVNVVTLYHSFYGDGKLASTVVDGLDNAMTAYEIQAERLNELFDGGSPAGAIDQNIEGLGRSIERLNNAVDEAEALGLPIGWNESSFDFWRGLDWSKQDSARDQRRSAFFGELGAFAKDDTACFLAWLFTTLMTGCLIGLGGPFWLDTAKRLNFFSGLVQSIRGKAETSVSTAPNAPENQTAGAKSPAASLTREFKTALRAQEILVQVQDEGGSSEPHRFRIRL